jgi:cell division septum initiation protein DivIVA
VSATPGTRSASADLEEVLDHLTALVEDARALPMSSSCVVHRGEVLDLVDEARRVLPTELAEARRVLADRERLLDQARSEAERLVQQGREEQARLVEATAVHTRAVAEAERLVQQGREEQARLVEATAVHTRAVAEADRMLDQAHAEAEAMRLQTEDYVDAKLANFENVLSTTLATVQRGRDRLSGRPVHDQLRGVDLDESSPAPG